MRLPSVLTPRPNLKEAMAESYRKIPFVKISTPSLKEEKNINDYQNDKNENRNQESSKNTFENQVVIVNNSGNNAALVEKVLQPTIQGVAVVCSGADDISVVSAVTNSVSVVLNVPTHKICVTKMR